MPGRRRGCVPRGDRRGGRAGRAAGGRGRVAVAMSGGVDSAVALLKAVEAGLEPVGVTLRLWIDPAAPDTERACCSPSSVRAARSACHALGVPHVTLDLREPFPPGGGRGVRRRPPARPDAEPVRALQRLVPLRRPDPVRRPDRRAAAGDRPLRPGRPPRRPGAARPRRRPGQGPVLHAGIGAAEILERVWFPLGEQHKTATRAEARDAGLAAAGRAESQEVCFVGGGDHRGSSSATAAPGRPVRS